MSVTPIYKGTYFRYDVAMVEPEDATVRSYFAESIPANIIEIEQDGSGGVDTITCDNELYIDAIAVTESGGVITKLIVANDQDVTQGSIHIQGKATVDGEEDERVFDSDLSYVKQAEGSTKEISVIVDSRGRYCINALPAGINSEIAFTLTGEDDITYAATISTDVSLGAYIPIVRDESNQKRFHIKEAVLNVVEASDHIYITLASKEVVADSFKFSFDKATTGSTGIAKLNSLSIGSIQVSLAHQTRTIADKDKAETFNGFVLKNCTYEYVTPNNIGKGPDGNDITTKAFGDITLTVDELEDVFTSDGIANGLVLKIGVVDLSITCDDLALFTDIKLNVGFGRKLLLDFVGTENTNDIFQFKATKFIATPTSKTSTIEVTVSLGDVIMNATTHFFDKEKKEIANIGVAVDEIIQGQSFNHFNFIGDAGFSIPDPNNDGKTQLYIRIADLYKVLSNIETAEDDVPELADRLHALEVACRDKETEEINQYWGQSTDNYKLWHVKDTYKALDISNVH